MDQGRCNVNIYEKEEQETDDDMLVRSLKVHPKQQLQQSPKHVPAAIATIDNDKILLMSPLPKTFPPVRAVTSATCALSSHASSTQLSIATSGDVTISFPQKKQQGYLGGFGPGINILNDNRVDDEQGDDYEMEILQYLSNQYRDGCICMDNKYRKTEYELQLKYGKEFLQSLQQQEAEEEGRGIPTIQQLQSRNDAEKLETMITNSIDDGDRKVAAKSKKEAASLSITAAPHSSMRMLKDDPLNYVLNLNHSFLKTSSEEMQKQQAIMDDIERQQAFKEGKAGKANVTYRPTNQCQHQDYSLSSPHATNTSRRNSIGSHSQRSSTSTSSFGSRDMNKEGNRSPSSSSSYYLVDDHVSHLSNGKTIRVKGTKHTYRSIAQGQATLVKCPSCHTMFQISSSAKLLYCTTCQQVTPMDVASLLLSSPRTSSQRGLTAGTRTSGRTGVSNHNSILDNQIACIVQRQEIQVAQTLKRSKI